MKFLVVLAVVALLIVAGVLYFGSGELDVAPKNDGTVQNGPKQNFNAVTGLLTQDMSSVPTLLAAPDATPTHAFSIKSRLGAAAAARPEYQTLAQVCDLIIYADQEHSVRRLHDQQAQQSISGDPMANARANEATTTNARAAIHAKAEADWASYRQQTGAEVKRLLASLQNVQL